MARWLAGGQARAPEVVSVRASLVAQFFLCICVVGIAWLSSQPPVAHGADLNINGTVIPIGGSSTYDDVSITNGGMLQVLGSLQLTVTGSLTIDATSRIDANGVGSAGGSGAGPAAGTGAGGGGSATISTFAAAGGGGGAGHGGFGGPGGDGGGSGAGHAGSGGMVYGTANPPHSPGSGGGRGGTSSVGAVANGGAGGGLVVITAGSINLNGVIDASGRFGSNSLTSAAGGGGGGSGGTIVIFTPVLLGTSGGMIANGGIGGSGGSGGVCSGPGGGGGAGGRIKLHIGNAVPGTMFVGARGAQGGPAGSCGAEAGVIGAPGVVSNDTCFDTDCDAFGFPDVSATSHQGPSNTNAAVDNCAGLANASQFNTDGNFFDHSPPYAAANDDKTQPNSDALGDACDVDDDNDGLADTDEASGAGCGGTITNQALRDTDGDRFLDGAECALGADPLLAASRPSVTACAAAGDPDGDKIQTRLEVCHYGTNPNAIDSDGDAGQDGAKDGCEIASLNGDRIVSSIDQGMLASGIVGAVAYTATADVNKDGVLSSIDQGIMASFIVPSGQCP